MSSTSRLFHCTPEDVFDVLGDGWSFATWVVGAARIRDVDDRWPEAGSRIHHSVGLWPLLISDTTSVDALDAPRMIKLTVRAWPAGEGKVRILAEPVADGTLVTIEEDASSGPVLALLEPLRDLMLHWRNGEALRRLSYLAEARGRTRDDTHGHGAVPQTRRPADDVIQRN